MQLSNLGGKRFLTFLYKKGECIGKYHHLYINFPYTSTIMSGTERAHHREIISEEEFESCLKEIELMENQKVPDVGEEQGALSPVAQDEACPRCKGYTVQYEEYRSKVASVRVEAEMIEAELEGIEYVKGRVSQDEACVSAVAEVYASILLRRTRLIQDFTNHLRLARPVTALRRRICTIHQGDLPAMKILEDATSDLLLRIWSGDINYVPHSRR